MLAMFVFQSGPMRNLYTEHSIVAFTKFQLIWPNFYIGQSQTGTVYGDHSRCPNGTDYRIFVQDLSYIIPTK